MVITGKRVNRRGSFGLEVPWEYIFEGNDFSCEQLHRQADRMSSAVLIDCKTAAVNLISTV